MSRIGYAVTALWLAFAYGCFGGASGVSGDTRVSDESSPAGERTTKGLPPIVHVVRSTTAAAVADGASNRPDPVLSGGASLAAGPPPAHVTDGAARLMKQASGPPELYPMQAIAFHHLAQIFSQPSVDAHVGGYARRGGRLRVAEPTEGPGCSKGWHRVEGGGYLCAGRGFAVGRSPKLTIEVPVDPELSAALPYRYAKVLEPSTLQYFRLPTPTETRTAQLWVSGTGAVDPADAAVGGQRRCSVTCNEGAVAPDGGLGDGGLQGGQVATPSPVRDVLQRGFYVSVDRVETTPEGLEFVRTVRGGYISRDRLAFQRQAPRGAGVAIAGGRRDPLALVYRGGAKAVRMGPAGPIAASGRPLPRFTALRPTAVRTQSGDRWWRQLPSGEYVDERLLRWVRWRSRPALVPAGARWIDVDLQQQVLVAYQGDQAVFATLVSTGKGGHQTPTGLFRIHAKHLSTTMDGREGGEEPYSIEDVPWTMYFQGSYALHTAFWHDRFGSVRSHGCINLTPRDARTLFHWSTPVRPAGFHGVMPSLRAESTYVAIRSGPVS